MSVLIEHQDDRLPPIITKDGVTVFRNLGFDDPTQQVIMEAARDASVRTAAEAGDGTTTATILAEAIVRNTIEFCAEFPKVSPQRVVRKLEQTFKDVIEPFVRSQAIKIDLGSPIGRDRVLAVAKISANGDTELANAVLECFDLTGDEGNVTIVEGAGASGYRVEHVDGYPIPKGFEDFVGNKYQKFINDPARQMTVMDKPTFILYHGRLTDIYTALPLLDKIDQLAQAGQMGHNVVLVATGFSETVIDTLAVNFLTPGTINVFPVTAPLSAMSTGQYEFLRDLAALSGAAIFDPMSLPLEGAEVEQLGSTDGFEATRFRSSVLGFKDELLILERVDEMKTLLTTDLAELDRSYVNERIGKISNGIARLRILGASAGELREKRDRAEDAICAVRGALKHGALPAGGFTLKQLYSIFDVSEDPILSRVLAESLLEPIRRLYSNAGYTTEEVDALIEALGGTSSFEGVVNGVYDVLEGRWVDAHDSGMLDSLPAVLEAIRNSLSISSLLGTCGGTVVFKRDLSVERTEARDTAEFLRNANVNEADQRG